MIYHFKAYAKINLYLHLQGKTDNLHIIDSLFAYTELHDSISVEVKKNGNHAINANYSLKLNDNLIYKIITEFLALYQKKAVLQIKHQKNIPMAAGMGGGSANAAIIFNFLESYFKLRLTLAEKINFTKKYGADIPFFLTNYARYIGGIGDKLEEIVHFPQIPILIINPKSKLCTKEVFSEVKASNIRAKIITKPTKFSNKEELIEFLENTNNDLANIALNKAKNLAKIYNYIDSSKYFVRVTGTGPTCFVIARNNSNLDELLLDLQENFKNYLILKSNILSNTKSHL